MERGKNLYLSIISRIKEGQTPSQISKELQMSKQRLNHYIATLKREGCIEKIGYGVWKYLKPFIKTSKRKSVVIGNNSGGSLKPNSVRGHGFLFKLDLQKDFRNWDKREKILKELEIKFDPYYVGGIKRGQRLTSQKTKVALTDKSILVNFPESYIADTSTQAKKDAIAKFLRVIKHLERILKADFSNFGKYKFRVSRQHYSLIKNSLAYQYLDDQYNSKKLHVYSGRGLWLLIDNSYNLAELETVHSKTADKDNTKVQDFFNGLDMVEGYTPKFVLEQLSNLNNVFPSMKEYNKNLKLHTSVQQAQLKTQKETLKFLKKIDERLDESKHL